MKKITIFKAIALVTLLGTILFYFLGTPAPEVSLNPETGLLSGSRELTLKLGAQGGILKKLSVSAVQAEKTVNVLAKEYPTDSRQATETFSLAQTGLKEGVITLQVTATGSATRFGADRSTTQLHSFTLDNKPPELAVLSVAHNIIQGGAGLVIYTVSKEVEKTGVVFGDQFYPGYRQGGDNYACLFSFPYNLDPGKFVPRVIAVDGAGNERQSGINYHLIAKNFSTDRIDLTDSFLEKIAAEFKGKFPQAKTPLEIFLKANRDERQQDLKLIYDYGRKSSSIPLWQGTFLRMPKTASLGGFAQFRTYLYQGDEVDQQTHLGFDLASQAHADVPAANRGKVVFADYLGIYGNCIIVDHGLGLQTIYGHLSRISVKPGDTVESGQVIGNTGATGMAGGDHLHYEMTISGQSVNPIEWWDAHWIKNNITGKLEIVKAIGSK
ncbi:MAG: M23 family metallopeptidase [Desulfuromonadaceae bacterium]|nr:M23 family metallopeptidase [Desulfuromonadaceae bacterium]